ncbi:MAG: hypothetical protein JWQ25_2510, partial [Daejeonella sp.]|nr:hypothetical protein [Daejeonella sp.]
GGIFIRSSESGIAYQIELDETSGSTGALLGERMSVSKSVNVANREKVWKANDWNSFRIRMVGGIPHITLWINGVQIWDVVQPKNDFIAGATQGMIGLQSHWTALYSPEVVGWNILNSWAPGAVHQFRNISIKKLDDDITEYNLGKRIKLFNALTQKLHLSMLLLFKNNRFPRFSRLAGRI